MINLNISPLEWEQMERNNLPLGGISGPPCFTSEPSISPERYLYYKLHIRWWLRPLFAWVGSFEASLLSSLNMRRAARGKSSCDRGRGFALRSSAVCIIHLQKHLHLKHTTCEWDRHDSLYCRRSILNFISGHVFIVCNLFKGLSLYGGVTDTASIVLDQAWSFCKILHM